MDRFAWTCITALGLATFGCMGEDVYIESSRAEQGVGVACQVAPGEAVCDRAWEELGSDRAEVVPFLEVATTFAGRARIALTSVADACPRILEDLGVAQPPLATTATLRERAESACNEVVFELGRRAKPTALSVAPGACMSAPAPACARQGTEPRTTCEAPTLALTYSPGTSGLTDAAHAALERDVAEVIQVRQHVEQLARLSLDLRPAPAALRSNGGSACVASAVSVLKTASDEANMAAERASAVISAIHP